MARAIATESGGDIIAATATAPGAGAIAIVRMTGAGCVDLARRLFSLDIHDKDAGRLVLGRLMHPQGGESVDQCLACAWFAPHSFTGEDMVEFHLHGSPAVVDAALAACVAAGARLAQPGEFTRRAFLNGKLDLAQAEAVADLSRSQTEEARRAALHQLRGGLSARLLELRSALVQVTAELEASVDYPEEELPAVDWQRLEAATREALGGLDSLADTYRRGRRLQHGARVVLAGPPNAGKSSLFNAILRRERAIVTPHAGTTRDTLEAVVDLKGIPLTLIDTAGLRADPEEIEAMGIQRTREEIQSADLVLFLADPESDPSTLAAEFEAIQPFPHLLLVSKADRGDLSAAADRMLKGLPGAAREKVVRISAVSRDGQEELENEIARRLGAAPSEGGDSTVITSARHEAGLRAATESLSAALEGISSHLSPELIAVDLALALSRIDEILGRQELDEDILDAIFSTFCLGK